MSGEFERVTFDGAQLSIWRDGPVWDGVKAATLGGFGCDDAMAGAAAISSVCERLAGEGVGAVIGPMDGSPWNDYRFVVEGDGRAPFLMEPHNPPHYPEAFDAAGFDVIARYASAERSARARVDVPALPDGLVMRSLAVADFERELDRIFQLSLTAFAGNPFYRSISREAFLGKYLPFKDAIDPELVVLVEDGSGALAGFLFGVYDFAAADPLASVIMKTWASVRSGAGMAMAARLYETARDKGAERVINALFYDDGRSGALNARHGGEIFRRYALWGRRL